MERKEEWKHGRMLYATQIGLAEWKARDWFDEMEGGGWLDHNNHRPVRSMQREGWNMSHRCAERRMTSWFLTARDFVSADGSWRGACSWTGMIAAADPLTEVAGHDLFFVKDVVRRSEAHTSDKFDVYDPVSRSVLLVIREPNVGTFTTLARLYGKHPLTDAGAPFDYVVFLAGAGPKVLRMTKGSSALRMGSPRVKFFDGEDNPICTMEKILLCFGRKYRFAGATGGTLFTLQVKERFPHTFLMIGGKEVARLTSTWKGEHGEFFKEGFKYAISFSPDLAKDSPGRLLILALGLCYKRAID